MDANRARYGAHDAGGAAEGQYIRLRYSTQFTTGGRAHTIEMEVPVPVGASPELRDQLIREAEANMEQLYRRVEARARGQRPPESAQRPAPPSQQPAQPASSHQSQPAQSAQPARSASPDQRTQPPQSTPAAVPAAASAREGPSAISLTDRRAGASSAASMQQTQARPELPSVPGLASMGSGPLKLSEFIQIIRENWALAPKEAMELLQVKSLNNMNYRDLLRQLEPLVAQASANPASSAYPVSPASPANRPAPASSDAPAQPGSSSPPRPPMPASSPPAAPRREQAPTSRPAAPQANAPAAAAPRPPMPSPVRPSSAPSSPSSRLEGPANIPVYPLRENMVREPARVYKFDEEEEEEEDDEPGSGTINTDDGEEDGEEADEEGSMSEAMARIKIDELRDMRGTVTPNPGRLVVLHNLLDSQISDDQFLQLIERLWNAVSDKKLKQDQVEGLISWAKEDYFEDEVRAVLSVLNDQA